LKTQYSTDEWGRPNDGMDMGMDGYGYWDGMGFGMGMGMGMAMGMVMVMAFAQPNHPVVKLLGKYFANSLSARCPNTIE